MSYSKPSAVLLLAVFVVGASGAAVPVTPCDSLGATGVSISDIDLNNLYLGEKMMMKFRLNTNRALSSPELHFDIASGDISVPCDPKTESGSCVYSLCGKETYNVEEKICSAWKCKCPIQPGSYMDPAGLQLTLPSLPGLLGQAITSQNTDVTLRLKDGGTTFFCGKGSVRIQSRNKKRSDDAPDDSLNKRNNEESSKLR